MPSVRKVNKVYWIRRSPFLLLSFFLSCFRSFHLVSRPSAALVLFCAYNMQSNKAKGGSNKRRSKEQWRNTFCGDDCGDHPLNCTKQGQSGR